MGNISSRQVRPTDSRNSPPENSSGPPDEEETVPDSEYPGQYRRRRRRTFLRNLHNLPSATTSSQLQSSAPTIGTRRQREEDSSEAEDDQSSDGRRSRPRLEQDLLQFITAIMRDPNFQPVSPPQTSSVAIPLVAPTQGEPNSTLQPGDGPRRSFLHRALDHLRRFGRHFSLSEEPPTGTEGFSPLLSSFPRVERVGSANVGSEPGTESESAQRILRNNRFIVTIRVLDPFEPISSTEAATTTTAAAVSDTGTAEVTDQEPPTSSVQQEQQPEGQPPSTRMIRFQYVIYFLDRPASAQLSQEQISAIEARVQNILALYTEMAALLTSQYGDTYEALTRLSELLGNVSRGVSLESIEEQLGRQLFKETGLATGFACSICLMEVGSDEAMRTLPCGHCFHVDCIDTWLQQCNNCPLCRTTPVQRPGKGADNTPGKPSPEHTPSNNR